MSNLPDNAVCALAQLLGDIVALIDDKVLVEDLEDLATLQVGHDKHSYKEENKKDGRKKRDEVRRGR